MYPSAQVFKTCGVYNCSITFLCSVQNWDKTYVHAGHDWLMGLFPELSGREHKPMCATGNFYVQFIQVCSFVLYSSRITMVSIVSYELSHTMLASKVLICSDVVRADSDVSRETKTRARGREIEDRQTERLIERARETPTHSPQINTGQKCN